MRTTAAQSFLKPTEVAAELRCSLNTVHRAMAAGDLPALRYGRTIRISREALDEFIAKQTEHGADQLAPRRRRRSA